MRLLVVDDDIDIRGFLKKHLEKECFAVDVASDGEEASYLARTNEYDLVILDLNLPKKDGLQVCSEVRAGGKSMPILILSVKSEIPEKVALLRAGADDYVTKPFSFEEIVARIHAILRRPKESAAELIRIGDLEIDSSNHVVKRQDKEIYLTRKEFLLLEYLAKNRGKLLSRGMIMEHVWDKTGNIFSNTIETHILNLRKKIDFSGMPKLIHTVSGRGYKLEALG